MTTLIPVTAMYGVVWVALICMYWTGVRRTELMGKNAQAFSLQG